jgi:DNA polymerase-3 subunit alpha
MSTTFWSAHTHSKYSVNDALPEPQHIVDRAVELGYPALGLTDHGNMGGAAQLYVACKKAGIKPLPGVEAYIHVNRGSKSRSTMHMGMLATNTVGYRNLASLVSQSHKQFYYKPVLDFADFAQAAHDGRLEGVAALSGCWFGVLPKLLREGDTRSVRNLLTSLDSWFGSGLYIELQHHNIDKQNEDTHVAQLDAIARSLGIPTIITQDSHYCHEKDRADHDMLKTLASWSDDVDDAIFPGDGYHMVDRTWLETRYTPEQLERGLQGLAHLESIADVTIPELDSYKLHIPDTGGNPDKLLREAVTAGFMRKVEAGLIPVSKRTVYQARVEEELTVVIGAGFSGYLLLTQTVCDFMREKDIFFGVRGSASGSLLCWLLGITTMDSIKWNLPFDRFLSRDRTKPPDIDLDIEHRRRVEVIDWISSRHHTVRIGSWGRMNVTEDDDGDSSGSLIRKWQSMNAKRGGDRKTQPGPQDLNSLKRLATHKPFGNFGVHAAGLMITPDEATAAVVPVMYSSSSGQFVTQFDMDDIEKLGFVKLDLLNGMTMTSTKITLDLLGLTLDEIPFNDTKTFRLICTKDTTALFQLEGGAFARGMRQLKPNKFTDLIAAMALYRPAVINSGATERYINRRIGKEPIPVRHKIITDETAETYGVVLYQEQVLNILKKLGLTVEEIEKARKAIKSSNDNVAAARKTMAELQKKIQQHAFDTGMSAEDIAWLNEAVNAYADYGFNKAHSTSYAVMAYVTAYLRANYPLEFWAGVLDAYGDSKGEIWWGKGSQRTRLKHLDAYPLAAREDGVTVLPVHVNKSKKSWSVEPKLNAIRQGLESVHKVGDAVANEIVLHQPYTSLDDLAMRVSTAVSGAKSLGMGHSPAACGGAIAALDSAGALAGLDRDPLIEAEREHARKLKEEKAAQAALKKAERAAKAEAKAAQKEETL